MDKLSRWLLLGAAVLLPLTGCVVAPVPVAGDAVVYQAPPPPRAEVVGVAPGPAYVWISGYWVWNNRWSWHRGYWTRRPRAGTRWVPGYWRHRGNEWRWNAGHWRHP